MSLKNFYDIDKIQAFTQDKSKIDTNDAGIMLSRHLTTVNPKILETQYPDLAFSNLGLPIDNIGGHGTEIQTLRLKKKGGFGGKGKNRGTISLDTEDSKISVYQRELEVPWTYSEVQFAQEHNFNIVDRLMSGAMQAFNESIDTSAITGLVDATQGIDHKGLVNNSVYDTAVSPAILDGQTAEEIHQYIADQITAQFNTVNNTAAYKANVCLLPLTTLNLLENRRLNTYSNETILTVLKTQFSGVTFIASPKADIVGNKSMAIFSNDPQAVAFRIPVPLQFSPVLQQHWEFSTVARYNTAGLDILEPSSGRIVTGL